MENTNFILGLNSIPKLGNKNQDVTGWITQLDTWFQLGGIEEEGIKVLWSKTTAVGDALDLIKNLCEEKEDITLAEIKGALETYYGSKRNLQSVMEELSTITIGNNETVKEFNLKFKKLVNKLPKEKRTNFNVFDYIKALKNRKRVWEGLVISDCSNLNDAYEKAERYDKLEEEKQDNFPTRLMNATVVNSGIRSIGKQCFNCGNWGHIKRFCPLNRTSVKPQYMQYPGATAREGSTPKVGNFSVPPLN